MSEPMSTTPKKSTPFPRHFQPFKLERYFDIYEFTTKYIACASDSESYSLQQMLSMADSQCLELWNNLSLGYTE